MIAQLLAIAALGLGAGPAVHAYQPTLHSSIAGAASSRNWAGYVSEGDLFNGVSATWVQPKLDCSKTGADGAALFWVGLDGWNTDTVEQGGSYATCDSATHASYWLWWEMYPQNTISVSAPTRAGDTIFASVRYVAPTFVITETDVTTGQSNEEDVACQVIFGVDQCKRSSVEVIAEDPGIGIPASGFSPLADYHAVRFTNALIHDHHGKQGGFNAGHPWFAGSRVVEKNGSTVMASPGALSNSGRNFSVTWKASK